MDLNCFHTEVLDCWARENGTLWANYCAVGLEQLIQVRAAQIHLSMVRLEIINGEEKVHCSVTQLIAALGICSHHKQALT